MAERMLVTQALDERDLMVKKIGDKIEKIKLVDTKKCNEEKTMEERLTEQEFSKNATSAFQQIQDLIARYQRLDAAIVASNAATTIETSQGTYTVAGAISLRGRLKARGLYDEEAAFESRMINQLEQQYQKAVGIADLKQKAIERQAEDMRMSILGRDSKNKDTKPLEVVDAYIRENTTELVDPLDAKNKADEMSAKIDSLLSELDTRIKVSNATTFIEF